MDVKAITLEYLKTNGYDGLFGDECGCKLDDLFPCGYAGTENCNAGYLQAETPPDYDFCIGPSPAVTCECGGKMVDGICLACER